MHHLKLRQAALVTSAVLILSLLSACQSLHSPEDKVITTPARLAGDKPFLSYQSHFFTAPEDFDLQKYFNAGRGLGIYSEQDGDRLVRRLDRRRGVDLMSAPAAASLPGKQVRIEMIREFIYATEFTPPKTGEVKTFGDMGAFPVTPASPTKFGRRNLGISANYRGRKLGNDLIELEVKLERSSLLGMVNYGSPIQTVGKNALGKPVPVILTENRIEQPVFDTKRFASTVNVRSGQFLLVGGLRPDGQKALEKSLLPPESSGTGRAKHPDLEESRSFFALIQVRAIDPEGN